VFLKKFPIEPGDAMTKPKLLMIGAYPERDMEALAQDYHLLKLWEAADQNALMQAHAADIRAVATRGDLGANKVLIDSLPSLEIIACFGVGVDAIDLAATRARAIKVCNTPDVLTGDVADLALALMLAVARNIPASENFVRAGKWAKASMPLATRVFGKRIGIVGLGRIGRAIARRAEGFDMQVSYHSRNQLSDVAYHYCATVEALAAQCDFLVAAVSGGAATQGLVSAAALAALGPTGYFINVARGSVVDQEALLKALESRSIKGAGLDVFLNEPNIDARFLALENLVLLPHVGSGTVETRRAMGQLVRDNLAAHFAGSAVLTPVH
jgi:lactate dehydrogenase-like 2-hydroxyacid dehydrogenase